VVKNRVILIQNALHMQNVTPLTHLVMVKHLHVSNQSTLFKLHQQGIVQKVKLKRSDTVRTQNQQDVFHVVHVLRNQAFWEFLDARTPLNVLN